MSGRVILCDICKDEVVVTNLGTGEFATIPVTGGFRGFKNVSAGSWAFENSGLTVVVDLQPEAVAVCQLADQFLRLSEEKDDG